ncbi:MAG: ABC transporter ATP-binding protein [Trueperaceae bacterium]
MSREQTSSGRRRFFSKVWGEARSLIWAHRDKLGIGLLLMVVNRLAGFVLPGSSKFLIDNVIGRQQLDLLLPLALAVGAATVVQAVTTFALSQVVSVAAQGAIMDMRRRVQEQVTRLPVRFFDGTQTGVLISRIMSDAEGIRNLVGTGIPQPSRTPTCSSAASRKTSIRSLVNGASSSPAGSVSGSLSPGQYSPTHAY